MTVKAEDESALQNLMAELRKIGLLAVRSGPGVDVTLRSSEDQRIIGGAYVVISKGDVYSWWRGNENHHATNDPAGAAQAIHRYILDHLHPTPCPPEKEPRCPPKAPGFFVVRDDPGAHQDGVDLLQPSCGSAEARRRGTCARNSPPRPRVGARPPSSGGRECGFPTAPTRWCAPTTPTGWPPPSWRPGRGHLSHNETTPRPLCGTHGVASAAGRRRLMGRLQFALAPILDGKRSRSRRRRCRTSASRRLGNVSLHHPAPRSTLARPRALTSASTITDRIGKHTIRKVRCPQCRPWTPPPLPPVRAVLLVRGP